MSSSEDTKSPPILLPVASGNSSFSTGSFPPSAALSAHDHILPRGWCCKVDANTNKYYFVKESADAEAAAASSSPSSSATSTPSPVYGRHQYQFSSARHRANEYAVERITKIFPEVDQEHVSYLLRIYHNREDVVVKALLGEGCRVEGMASIDESLFYKLRNNFPLVHPDTIRLMLVKHDNVEHEAIMAILSAQSTRGSSFSQSRRPSSPKLKLRYLKLLFPDVEENKLFDLLYNSDHDARKVITDLEHMGYKKTDVTSLNKVKRDLKSNSDEQMEKKAVRPTSIRLQFPVAISHKEKLVEHLKGQFPSVTSRLIELALDCCGFDASNAIILLNAMTPEDSDSYFKKGFEEKTVTNRLLPCISTQTKAFIETVPDLPIAVPLAVRKYEMSDRGTWTKEDGVILKPVKQSLARGPDPSLQKGPSAARVLRIEAIGAVVTRLSEKISACGPDASLRRGSQIERMGADATLRKGADAGIRILRPIPKSDDDSD